MIKFPVSPQSDPNGAINYWKWEAVRGCISGDDCRPGKNPGRRFSALKMMDGCYCLHLLLFSTKALGPNSAGWLHDGRALCSFISAWFSPMQAELSQNHPHIYMFNMDLQSYVMLSIKGCNVYINGLLICKQRKIGWLDIAAEWPQIDHNRWV